LKGVFAGGDDIPGSASVIGAVGAGKRAAESIDRYLKGEDILSARFESTVKPLAPELLPETKGREKIQRIEQAMLPVPNAPIISLKSKWVLLKKRPSWKQNAVLIAPLFGVSGMRYSLRTACR